MIGSFLFCTGLFLVLTKKNAILILMGLELIFNGANVNLVGASAFSSEPLQGQMLALFVIVVAACELTIALALVYKLHHFYNDSDVEALNDLGES